METNLSILLSILLATMATALAIWQGRRVQQRREEQRWADAWSKLESDPAAALNVFRSYLPSASRRRSKHPAWEHRARLGRAVCLIRLSRFQDAAEAEVEVRRAGVLSTVDEVMLARAWLSVPEENCTRGAIEVWVRLLALPAGEVEGSILQQVSSAVRSQLVTTPDEASALLQRAIEFGQVVTARLPRLSWPYYLLGIALRHAARWEEAAEALRAAIAIDPEEADAHLALARTYRELGDRRRGWDEFLAVYRLAPTPDVALEAVALLLLLELADTDRPDSGGEPPLAAAQELLEAATTRNPGHAASWMTLGQIRWRMGLRNEAVASLERAIVADPSLAEAHARLAQCSFEVGDRVRARDAAHRALKLDAQQTEAALLAGNLAYEDGNLAEAIGYYRHLNHREIKDATQLNRIASCYLKQGDPAAAVALLSGPRSLDMSNRLVLGRCQARTGRWSDALATLSAIDLTETSTEYLYYLAGALAVAGRLAEAEKVWTDLLDDRNWRHRARRQLGHLKLTGRDFDGASAHYMALNGHPVAAFDLARMNLLKGDADAAKSDFERVVASKGKSRLGSFGLACALAQLGDQAPLQRLAEDPELSSAATEELADQAFTAHRYAEAMEGYERLIRRRRSSPSTRVLRRMAIGYLHLGRFHHSLPPLVELSKRYPDSVDIRYNLALCRFQLGRTAFKRSLWELARTEFHRSRELLQSIDQDRAAAVEKWELEAAYREASRIITNPERTSSDLQRAIRLFNEGCFKAPDNARWQFGAGLALALTGKPSKSAERFRLATELSPEQAPLWLGWALSLGAATDDNSARNALDRSLKLLDSTRDSPRQPAIAVAARFALAMSYAKDRQWESAADALLPLIDHPLVKSSTRLTPADVAQAAVAWYAAGGLTKQAADLAQRHLRHAKGLSDVLIGLVRADSGDYSGAAEVLGKVYRSAPNKELLGVLVSCLLAAAADAILKGDLAAAEALVAQAVRYDSHNQPAANLHDAIVFARNLGALDLDCLDDCIARCESLLRGGDQSPHLVRTLAVMYHRRAVKAELQDQSPDTVWRNCINSWKQQILNSQSFWDRYASAYNVGKGRREEAKPEDLRTWRDALPSHMALVHQNFAASYLKASAPAPVRRHINLIWEWAPNFEPDETFLTAINPRELNDELATLIVDIANRIKSEKIRMLLKKVVAVYWYNKAATHLSDANLTVTSQYQLDRLKDQMRKIRAYTQKAVDLAPTDPDVKTLQTAIARLCAQIGI